MSVRILDGGDEGKRVWEKGGGDRRVAAGCSNKNKILKKRGSKTGGKKGIHKDPQHSCCKTISQTQSSCVAGGVGKVGGKDSAKKGLWGSCSNYCYSSNEISFPTWVLTVFLSWDSLKFLATA